MEYTDEEVRKLAAYHLGYGASDRETAEAFHDAHPHLAGWWSAICHLRKLGHERLIADHGALPPEPEEIAARQLEERYWRSVARVAGWTDETRDPTASEIVALQRETP